MSVKPDKKQKANTNNPEEKSEKDHPKKEYVAKNSPCDKTELTIQFVFTLAIIINFYTFIPTLHVAALIIIFKCMTNFQNERINLQEGQEQKRAKRCILHRKWRRKKRRETWKSSKNTAKLILVMLVGMHISDSLVRHGSPNSQRQTLYSLAHDPEMVNLPGSAFPIKEATITRDITKIRNDIKRMIRSMIKLLRDVLSVIDDTIKMRNKTIRIVTKMVIKVWAHLLGDHINAKNTEAYWSPEKCKDCELCKLRGPRPLCPFCNMDLIGPVHTA